MRVRFGGRGREGEVATNFFILLVVLNFDWGFDFNTFYENIFNGLI
jgi:hypothetical protein